MVNSKIIAVKIRERCFVKTENYSTRRYLHVSKDFCHNQTTFEQFSKFSIGREKTEKNHALLQKLREFSMCIIKEER